MQVSEKTKSKTMGKLFERIVRKLFSTPSINLIGSYEAGHMGVWKTGKTDLFLLLSEILLDLGLVDEVASNIETNDTYPYIHDLETLKYWLHKGKKTKLYGLDEANIHLPSRRAMSSKSVDIIQIFPEISKARARLVVIGQKLSSLDSELRGTGWVKGAFQKVDLKTVYITSPFFKRSYTFHDIPRTSIKFDQYLQAPFTLKPIDAPFFDNENFSKLYRFGQGTKMQEFGYHHGMTFNRDLRKWIGQFMESYHISHIHADEVKKTENVTN